MAHVKQHKSPPEPDGVISLGVAALKITVEEPNQFKRR